MKRYDLSIEVKGGEMCGAEMLKKPRGAYVYYSDHWSEVDLLQSELDKLVETGECAGCPENKRLKREVERLRERLQFDPGGVVSNHLEQAESSVEKHVDEIQSLRHALVVLSDQMDEIDPRAIRLILDRIPSCETIPYWKVMARSKQLEREVKMLKEEDARVQFMLKELEHKDPASLAQNALLIATDPVARAAYIGNGLLRERNEAVAEVKRLEETIDILTDEHNAQAVCAEEFAFLRGENARLDHEVKRLDAVRESVTDGMELSGGEVATERLAGNVVKEEFWKGELSAYEQILDILNCGELENANTKK